MDMDLAQAESRMAKCICWNIPGNGVGMGRTTWDDENMAKSICGNGGHGGSQ
jgi:hypothetical protein